jgi:hypothetical protein
MDTSRLGQVAADLMEAIDSEDGDELGVVLVLAEIKGSDEHGDWTAIRWRCSDPRAWVQYGVLHAALDQDRVVDMGDDD